jgi:hypothetical protein
MQPFTLNRKANLLVHSISRCYLPWVLPSQLIIDIYSGARCYVANKFRDDSVTKPTSLAITFMIMFSNLGTSTPTRLQFSSISPQPCFCTHHKLPELPHCSRRNKSTANFRTYYPSTKQFQHREPTSLFRQPLTIAAAVPSPPQQRTPFRLATASILTPTNRNAVFNINSFFPWVFFCPILTAAPSFSPKIFFSQSFSPSCHPPPLAPGIHPARSLSLHSTQVTSLVKKIIGSSASQAHH